MNISAPGESAGRRQLLVYTIHITTASIVSLFMDHLGVHHSITGMNKWLHRNGFTWKKLSGIPHKFCAEKQQQFIKHYEALKQTAGDSEPILFRVHLEKGKYPTLNLFLSRHSSQL